MNRIVKFIVAALVVSLAACTQAPPPLVTPTGEARFLIDPRTGWTKTTVPAADRAFENAWRSILAEDYPSARKSLDTVRAKDANYGPAALAEAAIAIREARYDAARTIVNGLVDRYPDYTAASVYAAEIDLAQGQIRSAYDRYRAIAAKPGAPPEVNERLTELQTRVFDQLYHAASTAGDVEAVRLLREALLINPSATAARLALAQRLISLKRLDEASRELGPLVNSSEVDRPEVQEALAEIEVGRERYQQAINRYERLARRDPDGRYARRLQQIKERFAEANMPQQYMHAVESEAITRADLATLMYWKVAAIRFAQDVPAPPIAIDVSEVEGRDELVRAIALGIFPVDPVTRRVNALTTLSSSQVARIVTRVLTIRGASCARNVSADRVLSSCGIDDPTAVGGEVSVSGRTAAAMLEQVDRALR